jgi:hypothetical protein
MLGQSYLVRIALTAQDIFVQTCIYLKALSDRLKTKDTNLPGIFLVSSNLGR